MTFETLFSFANRPFSGSVARRLSMALVVLGVIATLVTTTVQTAHDYQTEIDLIDERFESVRITHGPSLAASVWSFSGKQIELELGGLLNTPGFEYAEIRTNSGEIWNAGEKKSINVIVSEIPLIFSKDGSDHFLGTLFVYADKQGIFDRVILHALESLLFFGTWVFFLAGSLFLIVRQLVTRHLNTLADYTSSISFDVDASPLVLDRPVSENDSIDELQQVSDAINSMRVQLVKSVSDLQESESRFRDFAESSSDWFWEIDENFKNTYVSTGLSQSTGFDSSYYIGKSREELTNENTDSEKWRRYKNDLDNHRPFRDFNFQIPTIDGSSIPASVNGTPIYDKDGNFKGYRGTGKDNSEIASLEEQFRRSQKMEAVGQLTGGIAHDFNNILGIVMGNLQILQRLVGDEEKAQSRIDIALKGVMRGADLTRKLLGFSRMEAHGTKLTSVNQFIENLEELLSRSLTVAINVEHHLSSDLWLVEVDPGDLQDTILNLALNARDAMPDGGRLVIETENKVLDEKYVRLNPQAHVGEFVKLSVSDNGHGMSPQIRERVLEPFFSTKEEGNGTGLGLSMVYGFVQRSGGHLSIYSEQGEGTTISLYLPRGKEEGAHKGKSVNEISLPGGSETILVVDDEPSLVDIAVSHLQDLGYRTITANSGTEALKILGENQGIDLLFSDIIMPGDLDGYQLAIAAQKEHPSLKALLTSGFTKKKEDYFSPDGSKYAEFAANLLHKPYNQTELAIAVRNTLDDVKGQAAPNGNVEFQNALRLGAMSESGES